MLQLAFALALSLAVPAQDAPLNHWTVLYYGCSDNDSEESFCPDIDQLRRGLHDQAGLEVFCLVDRSPKYSASSSGFGADFAGTRLYRLTKAKAERLSGGELLPDIAADSEHEADTGDATTVRDYIRWAKAEHPAQRYAMVFYSHGNGVQWCPDESDGSDLYPAELTDVLAERDSLDLVVFDVCSMAGIENAYEWRPAAGKFGIDVVVATPMAGFPFPWRQVYSRIRSGAAPDGQPRWFAPRELTATQFGNLVVEETERHRRSRLDDPGMGTAERRVISGEAMTCMDLRHAAAAKSAVDALAVALAAEPDGKDMIELIRGSSRRPESMCYDELYFDVHDLARRLVEAEFSEPLTEAAERVVAAIDALVLSSYGLTKYDRFGGFVSGLSGVYVVVPPHDVDSAQVWRLLSWYRPERGPDDAAHYGNLAWCRDGATPGNGEVENWFELLDAWHDAGAGAGRNGYER